MRRGLATLNLYADDLAAARAWYTEVLGIEPYFVREIHGATAYVEYRVGPREDELGLVDARFAAGDRDPARPGGAVVYWHVDDLDATLERLLALGARLHEPRIERGPGFVTAAVVDPFGNVLGVMYNQHFAEGTRT